MVIGSPEANKRQVRSLFAVFSGGDLDDFDRLLTDDMVNHEAKDQPLANRAPGAAGMRQVVTWLRGAFRDLHYEIESIVAEGDLVAVRVLATGAHVGMYRGMQGTGKAYRRAQMHFFRFTDGRIAEHWAARDDLGAFIQLGFLTNELRRPE